MWNKLYDFGKLVTSNGGGGVDGGDTEGVLGDLDLDFLGIGPHEFSKTILFHAY